MFKRKAEAEFELWLKGAPNKALLVKGARQVGKSYLVQFFAAKHFPHVVTFDLLKEQSAKSSFSDAKSADDLMLRISVAATEPLVPGNTVVVIDEVQEALNILTYIKYLVQKGEYRFILTGSLLGVKLENIDSLPVGYVRQVEMFPLDFEEFCWACGLGETVYAMGVEHLLREEPLPDFLYERLADLFHRYLMVGGMPDAVRAFVDTNNIDEVRAVHRDLHDQYRADITKHAPEELRLIIRDIYDLIPSEAASRNKRFKLSSIQNVKRFDQVHQHFLWLTNAGVALPVYNVSAPISPLLVNEQRNLFKLFYLDVGMLASRYPKSSYGGILDGKASMNMGCAYEAFVAQELAGRGLPLRYYASKKVGELDFLVERESGIVEALEVKSGGSYLSHAALDNAMAVKEYTIDRAVVLAETNVAWNSDILYAPVFLVGALFASKRY